MTPSPRLAAAELLAAVTDHGRSLERALSENQSFNALAGRDRGLARALVGAALRRLGSIDHALARCLQSPLPDTAIAARALLRIAAADLLVLETPAHAAVSEAVTLAHAHAPRYAALINAVLRRVDREGREPFAAAPPGSDLPDWLFTRWRAAYGEETATQIAQACRSEPPLDLSVKADAAGWAERLGATLLPTGSLRLCDGHAPITELPGYAAGAWWVQDAAAALPAHLLGDVAGLRVLDLCAAPGGKTLQLAAAGAHVTALDSAEPRLARVRENLARTALAAEIVCADARAYAPETPFDAVLLDAPCTATGTIRRRPDIAWLRRPSDIPALAALQAELIAAAARCVKPGGRVVYAVCSLEPEEGEAIVTAARAAGLAPADPPGPIAFLTPTGALRTLPSAWADVGGLDGFFAQAFVRSD